MRFTLCTVDAGDAELLVRNCDFPAMQNNPLHLTMFPNSCQGTEEEELKWSIEALRKSILARPAWFRKVCLEDGTPVGFAGWNLEQTTTMGGNSNNDVSKERKKPNDFPNRDYWHPNTLDVEAWMRVSRLLREERIRVLCNRKDIWRLTILSVDPRYQRQGIGSMLLGWGCEEADAHERDSFLMASPAGINLYTKFGFKAVGDVHTSTGTFTSMLREANRSENKSLKSV
ncbi:acyl-CoA N-acyltransferase [Penicillium frequentans]|nr:acyl-CoA N-acyltransferase [Penicillium glabrum]